MSSNLTLPAAQWTADKAAAGQISSATFYQVGSTWFVTDDPTNAAGHTVGYLRLSGSLLVIDDSLTSGLAAVLTPQPRLIAHS